MAIGDAEEVNKYFGQIEELAHENGGEHFVFGMSIHMWHLKEVSGEIEDGTCDVAHNHHFEGFSCIFTGSSTVTLGVNVIVIIKILDSKGH